MPYKDPNRKKEWERLHRPQRLARRRELRTSPAERIAPHHSGEEKAGTEFVYFIPLIAGGMLAAYNPKLGMGAGVLTIAVAAGWKKNWAWWVVGSVVLLIGLLFYFTQDKKSDDSLGSGEHV